MNWIRRWLCLILLVGITLGYPTPAEAHGFQTAYLELREQPSGQIDVGKHLQPLALGMMGMDRRSLFALFFPNTVL